jgi:hypothetical protein
LTDKTAAQKEWNLDFIPLAPGINDTEEEKSIS